MGKVWLADRVGLHPGGVSGRADLRLLFERRRRQLAEVQLRQRMTELAHSNRYSLAGELAAAIAIASQRRSLFVQIEQRI